MSNNAEHRPNPNTSAKYQQLMAKKKKKKQVPLPLSLQSSRGWDSASCNLVFGETARVAISREVIARNPTKNREKGERDSDAQNLWKRGESERERGVENGVETAAWQIITGDPIKSRRIQRRCNT